MKHKKTKDALWKKNYLVRPLSSSWVSLCGQSPYRTGLAIKYLEVNLNELQIYALSDHLAL